MASRRKRYDDTKYVMISVVATRFSIHPQTLRLYEREGLITPSRSAGNTRLYDERAIRRLEMILLLTRDLGVNLAGVEVILDLVDRLGDEERDTERILKVIRDRIRDRRIGIDREGALVRYEKGPPPVPWRPLRGRE